MLQAQKSLAILLLLSLSSCVNSLVVPQELPSLLSLVYSNIPQIKKGTDSRVGFGFRLGEHADFQVMLELGPQKNTQPIGDLDSDNSFSKRQISKTEQRQLLLRLHQQQQQQKLLQQQQQNEMSSTERTSSNWLQNWSKGMNGVAAATAIKKKPTKLQKSSVAGDSQGIVNAELLPTMPVMQLQALQQLQLLHKMATTQIPDETNDGSSGTPAAIRKTKGEIMEELMDVRLD